MLDLASLAIFLQVAESGSITRAAQQLGRAQSNVTTRIQQLEESLGVQLFVREARRMVLTPEGLRLQRYAGQLLSLAEEAEQNLRADVPSGRLRLGSMESTAAVRLPQPLAPCTTMFITRSGYRTPAVQQLLSVLKSHRAPDAR